MALIVDPFTFTNGTIADATEVNARISTIYTLVNGNINAANMDSTAAFTWSGVHTFEANTIFDTTFTITGVATFVGTAEFASANFSNSLFCNSNLDITGASSSADLLDLNASSLQTGQVIDLNATALTTGNCIDVSAPLMTTGSVLNMPNLDSLTSGAGVDLISNSSDASTRQLINVRNDNAAATGTACIRVRQDSTGPMFRGNTAGADSILIQNDGAILLPDIDAPGSNEMVRMSGAKIWGSYVITASTSISTLDTFNSISVVVASFHAVTVSWGVNKMAANEYVTVVSAGGTSTAGDKFAAVETATSTRSQLGVKVFDLSVGGAAGTVSQVNFAVFGDAS